MHAYRVVSSFTPFEEAILVRNSDNIALRNLHIYSDSKAVFDGSVLDEDTGTLNHELEVAELTLQPGRKALPQTLPHVPRRLATGFFNASGLTASPDGTLYFVDSAKQNIYRFSLAENALSTVTDHPLDAANLAFDDSGAMLVVSYTGKGTVYTAKPDEIDKASRMPVSPASAQPGKSFLLPVDHWRFEAEMRSDIGSVPKPWRYTSADGTVSLPAGDDFVEGQLHYGTKMADVLRAFALRRVRAGNTFYVSDEGQERTYAGTVQPDGSLGKVHVFADRGGEAVLDGPDGRVYVAAGRLYVYGADGKLQSLMELPERPTGLTFAGRDGRTLVVLTRNSLYAVDVPPAR